MTEREREKKKRGVIPCGTVGTIKDVSSTGFLGERMLLKHNTSLSLSLSV